MAFRYLAYDSDGRQTRGILDVESEDAAERILWDQGLTIVDLKATRGPIDLIRLFPTFLGPRRQDVIIFSDQLANLLESGVGVVPALQLLADEVTSRPLQRVLREVVDDVRLGNPLSAALAKHDMVFHSIYARMIEVGERTGNLGFVLRQLARYMDKELSLTRKIRSASVYPLFLLFLAGVVVAIITNFTLPPLLRLYEEFGAELPWSTQALISVTTFFVDYRVHLFIAASLLTILLGVYVTRPSGRWQLHLAALRMPIIRRITVQGAVARMSRTLSTLLRAGVALPESLQLSKEVVPNVVVRKALEDLRREAIHGRGLSDPIGRNRLFPRLMAQIVRVGEETGTLDAHLDTLADFYEEEVDRSLKALTGVLEPALIMFVGLVVGFVAISVIMPMYTLLQAIR